MNQKNELKFIIVLIGLFITGSEMLLSYAMDSVLSYGCALGLSLLIGEIMIAKTNNYKNNLLLTISSTIFFVILALFVIIATPESIIDKDIIIMFVLNIIGLNTSCIVRRFYKDVDEGFSCYLKKFGVYFIICYTILMSYYLFFYYRISTSVHEINLKIFKTIKMYAFKFPSAGTSIAIVNLLGNLVMFIPIGFVAGIFIKGKKKTILLLILIPIAIEVIQYVTYTGVCDVDDFILNFTGELIGYITMIMVKRFHKRKFTEDSDMFKI